MEEVLSELAMDSDSDMEPEDDFVLNEPVVVLLLLFFVKKVWKVFVF